MPRPPCRRSVIAPPPCGCFKPAGIPARQLEDVVLTVDEYEALRLADYEALYQEQVAEKMGVSRQTIGRILQIARHKVAEALVRGKVLRIEGGAYTTGAHMAEKQVTFLCRACGHTWAVGHLAQGMKQLDESHEEDGSKASMASSVASACPPCPACSANKVDMVHATEAPAASGDRDGQGCGRGRGRGRHGAGRCGRGKA